MEKNEKLSRAVRSESSVSVRILLEQGADALAVVGSSGMNAVGLAASIGQIQILKQVLESCQDSSPGYQPRCSTQNGNSDPGRPSPVHNNWIESTPDGMGDLEWDEEIDTEKVFSPDKEWLDLYSYYARMWENIGQVLDPAKEAVKDVHCLDTHQMAPLHYAAKFGHLPCVRLLLNEYKCPVDIQTYTGQTALHLACEYQHLRVVKCLLQNKATVNLKTYKVEDTALLKAAKNGNNRIVQVLLDHGASINICNAYDVSPLIGSTFFGHGETVKYLIERGANVNLKDRDGLTALTIAVHNEAPDMVRCLLENSARVIPSHNLVHTAINLDNEEILRMLIKAGESVTRGRDSYGLLPIDKIIQRGSVEMLLFCYEYFRLDNSTAYDKSRELIMALHCEDVRRFRVMLRFFLNLGRNIDENDVFLTGIKLRKYEHVKLLLQENVQVNTEFNLEVIEMLQKDTQENLGLLIHLAGFRIHRMISFRSKSTTVSGGGESAVNRYLQTAYTNPLSLQDLTRIRIRTVLKGTTAVSPDQHQLHEKTPLERALWRCGLPPRLVRYIYEYSDLGSSVMTSSLS